MKSLITAGCLLLASAGLAQQSPKKAGTDSVRTIDNMPVVRNTGRLTRMPVQKDAGTPADMPTRRMDVPAQPRVPLREELDIPDKQLKNLKIDSLRAKPDTGRLHKKK